jgi:hypothetical protein
LTEITGREHWTTKPTADGDVQLFLWEKSAGTPDGKPAVLFVHGSSMASQPTFDLTVPGRPHSSVMEATLATPEVVTYMNEAGIESVGSTPAEMDAYFREERDRWARIVKETGAKID